MNVEKLVEGLEKTVGAVLENAQTPTPVPEVEPSEKKYETQERHDGRSLNYAKLYLWIGAVVLVVIQGFLIGWWTLLSGTLTFILAGICDYIISNKEDIYEELIENRLAIIMILLGVAAVIVEGFLLGWWTLLAGPATGLVIYGIYYLLDIIIDHFYE